jgi:cell division protein FtsB
MIIIDFLGANAYEEILNAIATIYISVLAIYVSNKEFERWYDKHEENHPGEIFVIIWSILIFSLFILDFWFGAIYHLPGAVVSSYIAVLTILVITRKSKELFKLKHKKSKK